MKKKLFLTLLLVAVTAVALGWYLRSGVNVEILNPQGIVAEKQRDLIILTVVLGMFVVIPVYIMTVFIMFRYRRDNKKAKYAPEFTSSILAESIWWGIPVAIILFLSIVTAMTTFDLDPYKNVAKDKEPLHVQVVSLDWKWLFIYPDASIASVNEAIIPANQPVDFAITSDSVMNSFWVPQLAGQIYSMPGMTTHLNITAAKGSYNGSSANISGEGFAGMRFKVKAVDEKDFSAWSKKIQDSPRQPLSSHIYSQLKQPSKNNKVTTYYPVSDHLFDDIVNAYMMPANHTQHDGTMNKDMKMEMGK